MIFHISLAALGVKLVKIPLLFYIFMTLLPCYAKANRPACPVLDPNQKDHGRRNEFVAAHKNGCHSPSQGDFSNRLRCIPNSSPTERLSGDRGKVDVR